MKRLGIFSVGLLLSLFPPSSERCLLAATDDPAPRARKKAMYREKALTLRSGKFKLPAKLVLPTVKGKKVPAVVLVHGSGPQDADETQGPNKPFRDLARGLAAKGIATLRYEKRTRKYGTTINPEKVTLEWETIDDALAAAELLRKRAEIDPKQVFVLGHSLGGMAAPLIAERDSALAGIVLMAANARPLVDLIEEQLEYISGLGGKEGAQAKQVLEASRPAIEAIRAGKPEQVKEPLLGAPNIYWAELSRRDPLAAAEKLAVPILVLQGGRDYQVTRKDYDLWHARLGKKPTVTFKLYDRLNHGMIAGDGKPGPADDLLAGKVDRVVIDDVATWINNTNGK